MVEGDDLRTALVAILLLHLQQILLHDLLAALGVVEDLLQLSNELLQIVELLVELIDTQACQLTETHIYDGLRLKLVEFEAYFEVALSIGRGLAITDNVYHLVDIVDGDDQALEDVGTLLSLAQIVLGTTDGNIVAMLNEVLNTLLERKQAGTTLYQSNIIN